MKQIPNLFTLLNLFFGCIAIVFILQTGESLIMQDGGSWVAQFPEKIWWGSIFIGIAAIIDFLDGFVARLFNATSAMGKQLDSLADVVSFGVAPAMILYQLLRIAYIQEDTGLDTSIMALLPAFIFPCAGAYRLARFNIDKSQKSGFKGVPIPAAGLVVASFPLILFGSQSFELNTLFTNKWLLYAVILVLSLLMVSRLPLMALKFSDFSVKNNLPKIILLGLSLIAIAFLQWLAVPVIFILYIIVSLFFREKRY
ncbi:CDP-diacylglycerol--serine O-phosphatidyltransferase [Flavitalea sp.]|nr:CDP-diacylglycerol--serine O-phosphatidyltransferase [Flavitalea sp.]